MKKLGVILVAAAVVIGCVLAAGCTTTTQSTDNPALTIDVVKTGDAIYNIGDTFTITLPSNPTTGFEWKDQGSTGVTITEESSTAVATSTLGAAGTQTFTYTAKDEGSGIIMLGYQKGSDDPMYYYADVMNIKESADNHSHGEFTYVGDYTPQVGKTVLITANGNETTGYKLVAGEDSGLTILKSEYVTAETEGLVGAGGTYKWYVTASEPNAYVFEVYEQHAGDSEKTLKFFVPISFAIEE